MFDDRGSKVAKSATPNVFVLSDVTVGYEQANIDARNTFVRFASTDGAAYLLVKAKQLPISGRATGSVVLEWSAKQAGIAAARKVEYPIVMGMFRIGPESMRHSGPYRHHEGHLVLGPKTAHVMSFEIWLKHVMHMVEFFKRTDLW